MNKIFFSSAILLLTSYFLPPTSCLAVEFVRTQMLMGNVPVSITIDASSKKRKQAFRAMDKAFAIAVRIENRVSEFQTESETSLLNQHAGEKWIPIGRDLMTILVVANKVSRTTKGAFDVTFASADKNSSYRDIKVDKGKRRATLARKGARVGLSGIAKGYIVDEMSRQLKKAGFRRFLVNAGGDLFASGRWDVGIRNPAGDDQKPPCFLTLNNQAASTSGTYERGNHIIDPPSHKPVKRVGSATIIAPHAVWADALATAAFVMPLPQIENVLKKIPEASLVLVKQASQDPVTEGLQDPSIFSVNFFCQFFLAKSRENH